METNYGTWTNWENTVAEMFAANTTPDVCQVNWNWLYSYSADGSVFLDLNLVSDVLDLSQFSDDALTIFCGKGTDGSAYPDVLQKDC